MKRASRRQGSRRRKTLHRLEALEKPAAVQPKLEVAAVNDPLEREADRIAEASVQSAPSRPAPGVLKLLPGPAPSSLQAKREGAHPERESPIVHDLSGRLGRARASGGEPLPTGVERRLAPKLGRSLGDVRVHRNAEAAGLARSLHAKAFTLGQDVFFNEGAFQPHTRGGQGLIAHELVHVVQQQARPGGSPAVIQRQVESPGPTPAPQELGQQAEKGRRSHIVAVGPQALKLAFMALPNAQRAIVPDGFGGQFELVPGQHAHGRMFVADTGGELFFLSGPALVKIPRQDFPRSVFLDAMGEGVATAAWIEPVGKVGFAFLVPFVGGLLGTIGTVAALTTFAVKMGLFYAAHQSDVHKAMARLPTVLAAINYLAVNCPRLALLLLKALAMTAAEGAKQGVGAQEVADLLGRLLAGISNAPSLGFRALAKIVGASLLATTAIRGPGAIARGAPKAAAAELVRVMRERDVDVSLKSAQGIIDEGCIANAVTLENLQALERGLRGLEPLLERLAKSLTVVE